MGSDVQTTALSSGTGLGKKLFKSVLFLWLILIGFAVYKYGDIIRVITFLTLFGGASAAIFYAQDRIIAEGGEGSGKRIWINALHWLHLILLGYMITQYYPVSREKTLAKIVAQVKDSMDVQKSEVPELVKYRDCYAIGRSLMNYQHHLTDSLLIESGIRQKDLSNWKRKVDSLVGDPLPEPCNPTGWQNRFLEEVRSLTQRKAVDEVDELILRFGIAMNARAIGQVDSERLRYGSIRNYLLRTVQGIQPMFTQAQPLFIDQFSPISEIVFIVKFNG